MVDSIVYTFSGPVNIFGFQCLYDCGRFDLQHWHSAYLDLDRTESQQRRLQHSGR